MKITLSTYFSEFKQAHIGVCLLILFLGLLVNQNAHSEMRATSGYNCDAVTPWVKMREQVRKTTDPKARTALTSQEYQLSRSLAQSFFQLYLKHKYQTQMVEKCLVGDDLTDFLYTMNSVFLHETVMMITQMPSSGLQNLIDRVGREQLVQEKILFRVTGHLTEKSPTELVAGFNRAGKNIYLDISKVNPEDWVMVFIHELSHLADARLKSASDIFANELWIKEFLQQAKTVSAVDELPPDVQNKLQIWIRSGLDRGLWFEYRAWYETLVIYKELQQAGYELHSPLVEYGLSQLDHDHDFKQALYLFLDKYSTDPAEKFFAIPLIHNALNIERESARQSPPPLR